MISRNEPRMNRVAAFLTTALLGGMLFVLPAWLAVLVLTKILSQLQVIVKPVTARLPDWVANPGIAAAVLLIAVCFLVGLVIQTAIGARVKGFAEERILNKLPGYSILRGFSSQLTKFEKSSTFQSALIEVEDALVPGFVIEDHSNDRCTVFIPSVPTLLTGSLYILDKGRVHRLRLPAMALMQCVSKWGVGSGALVAALDAAEGAPEARPLQPDA